MESEENREQPIIDNTKNNTTSNTTDNKESLQPVKSQPISKIKAIELLNDTIDRLEEIVEKISTSNSEQLPPSSSITILVKTTQELAAAIESPSSSTTEAISPSDMAPITASSPQPEPIPATIPEPSPAPQPIEATEVTPTSTTSVTTSQPVSQPVKKNNWTLIGAIASGVVVLIVAAVWWWFPQQPVELLSQSEPKAIDTEITDTEITDTEITDTEIVVKTDEIEPQTREIAKNKPIKPEETANIPEEVGLAPDYAEPGAEAIETIPTVEIPSELVSPGKSKAVKLETIEPEIQLTPEQTLIAAIQTRVAEITQDYSEDLIESVQADFRQNSLLVKVSDVWYQLGDSRQSKLANEMLKRSRQLDFFKLEIKDTQGTLVARNPVVGNNIIILQRNKLGIGDEKQS